MSDKARIGLELGGDDAVVRGLKAVLRAQQEIRAESKKASDAAKADEKNSIVTAGKGAALGLVAIALHSVTRAAVDYSRASNDIKPLNFQQSADRAKAFDDVVTRMAVRSGKGVDVLMTKFKQSGAEIGVMPERIAAASRALTKLTYGNNTADAMKDLGDEANDTDRSLEEMVDIGASLNTKLGTPLDKLGDAFGKIKTAAADFATIGGHIALEDTLLRLGPELARFGGGVEHAAAVVAAIGKGKSPEVAQRQAGTILAAIGHADPILLDRVVKSELHDKNARAYVTNANGDDVLRPDILEIIQRRAKRNPGGIRGLTRFLGNDVGAARALWEYRAGDVQESERRQKRPDPGSELPAGTTSGLDDYWAGVANKEAADLAAANKPVTGSKLTEGTTAGRRAVTDVERANAELGSGEKTQANRDAANALHQGNREGQLVSDTIHGYLPPVAQQAADVARTAEGALHRAAHPPSVKIDDGSIHKIVNGINGKGATPASGPAAKAVEDNKAKGRQWNN